MTDLADHLRTARVMLANYANHDTEEDAEYTRGVIDRIDAALARVECERCAGTGITGHRARTGTYVGPGPVPEDARGFVESTCSACRGTGASND